MSEKVQSNIKDKGVRYFSNTASFYVSKNVSKTTNKSLKLDSPIFNNLNIIIRNNPINEETQIKIEKFLFDYSYICISQENREE